MCAYYPESKVELRTFTAKHYDALLDMATLGRYSAMIRQAVRLMGIKPDDRILDLGAGTGKNACLMQRYLSSQAELVGLDISSQMIAQFERNCAEFPNIRIIDARIDQELPYDSYFDKVFISFVLHGFPQEARDRIIGNAFKALREGGEFFIMDYNQFSFDESPFFVRTVFKFMECPYAFDFIERDLGEMLARHGFGDFTEHLFFSGYLRLFKGVKIG